ncbi:MAG TPA: ABC transporter substrate binding protein [Candidatus Competibacteraceae bacterium]|nr:ABC transporter substrate binding protein [Candidatus Competibacteraceae bacterium]
MFRVLAAIVLLLFLVMPVGAEPTPRQIMVLLNAADDAQQRFFQAFQSHRVALGKPVEIIQQGGITAAPTGDLVVAVGTRACLSLLESQSKVPVVCTLVPRLAVAEALSTYSGQATALYLDQPFQRQLNLLEQILPHAREVGFVAGPTSQKVEPELATALQGKGLRLHSLPYHRGDNIVSVLQRFDPIDVMLAYPDPVVFSAENIYPLLLTTYHQNIPTLGFSSAFVDAGALAAVFSTPEQLGVQTAETVAQWLTTGQWPRPQHPRQFTVRTNAQVAKSLRLAIPSEQELQRQLTALEKLP